MAAHDKVNVATTPQGARRRAPLRFARSGEQPRGVGDIHQSNAVRWSCGRLVQRALERFDGCEDGIEVW